MLKLGPLTLDVPFFQAPLSGYSDYAMRKLAISFGAPLVFAGVMLAKSVLNPKVLSKPAFRPRDDEHPVGAQILGTEPQMMADAAKALVNAGYDLIDLNFACPAPKVLRRQRGGYLLKEPRRILEIYRSVKESVDCPVIMKLRTGFDGTGASDNNFWEIISLACAENVDALVIHPRTVCQRFKGSADWQLLAELKRRFPKMTIVGSGDLFDAATVAECLRTTGLDGAVIARGAIGNPWIFRDLRAIFESKPIPPPPTLDEQGRVMLKHFELVTQIYPPRKTIRGFRKFIIGYCKHHPERKRAQKILLAANNKEQLLSAVRELYGVG